jgi:hypothetical protein
MPYFRVLLEEELLLADSQAGSLVVVEIAVVWRREDCDDLGEGAFACPVEQSVAILLCLVASD